MPWAKLRLSRHCSIKVVLQQLHSDYCIEYILGQTFFASTKAYREQTGGYQLHHHLMKYRQPKESCWALYSHVPGSEALLPRYIQNSPNPSHCSLWLQFQLSSVYFPPYRPASHLGYLLRDGGQAVHHLEIDYFPFFLVLAVDLI